MNINTMPFIIGFGSAVAVAATVLAYIYVLPEKKRASLPKALQIVHDILNFKQLMIETVMRALYVLASIACVVIGVLMLFGVDIYNGAYFSYSRWYGGYGLLLAIVGPIVVRLSFEGIMMSILLVKNTIEINKKLKDQNAVEVEKEVVAEETTVETPETTEV